MILLDTNLLGRITDSADPQYAVARRAINTLAANQQRLVIVPQVLYEFWAVATRSAGPPPIGQNGLGMTVEQSSQWLRFFQRRFNLLPDRDDLLIHWHALVTKLRVTGHRSHDARIVAAMQSYEIAQVLTFNASHFRDLPVTALDPASV